MTTVTPIRLQQVVQVHEHGFYLLTLEIAEGSQMAVEDVSNEESCEMLNPAQFEKEVRMHQVCHELPKPMSREEAIGCVNEYATLWTPQLLQELQPHMKRLEDLAATIRSQAKSLTKNG